AEAARDSALEARAPRDAPRRRPADDGAIAAVVRIGLDIDARRAGSETRPARMTAASGAANVAWGARGAAGARAAEDWIVDGHAPASACLLAGSARGRSVAGVACAVRARGVR